MIGDKFFARLSSREKIGMALVVACVTVAVAYRAVVFPVYTRFREMDRDVALEKRKLEVNLKALEPARRNAIEREYGKYAKLIRQRTSPSEESALMLSDIESLAGKFRLNLIGTKPREAKATDFYEQYSVEVEMEGRMPDFVSFLYGLQESPQLLRVEKLNLAPKSKEQPSAIKGLFVISKVVTT